MRARAIAALLVAALAGPAAAAPGGARAPVRPAAARPAAPTLRVVLAPLSTLGAEASSAEVRATQRLVAGGLAATEGVALVTGAAVEGAVKRARRPQLRACDGEPDCLAELGRLLSADYTVYGEVGGLGGAHVVYLKLVDVRAGAELRSTVLELGGTADAPVPAAAGEARAAATRLLLPQRYVGRVQLDTRVAGASIFIDGRLIARAPARPFVLSVGSHALRVTHPEFRDFVRFVEVPFEDTLRVPVDLRPYRAVAGDIRRTQLLPPPGPDPGVQPTPWYRRWYTIAGAGAVLLVGSAVAIGFTQGGLSFDLAKDL